MIGAGIPKAQLMDSETMARVLTRMAHEIMERAGDLQDLILVGIRRRGVPLAQRLADVIEKVEGVRVPVANWILPCTVTTCRSCTISRRSIILSWICPLPARPLSSWTMCCIRVVPPVQPWMR